MKLFKLPEPLPIQCEPEPEALAQRETLMDAGQAITRIQTADHNQQAAMVGQAIRKQVNEVERTRKEITIPYLEAQRTIKRVADEYCAPLTKELHRLGKPERRLRQRTGTHRRGRTQGPSRGNRPTGRNRSRAKTGSY